MEKTKPIQTITAWRYPCDDSDFLGFDKYSGRFLVFEDWEPYRTKKDLLRGGLSCPCGENCKPQKIRITTEVVQ